MTVTLSTGQTVYAATPGGYPEFVIRATDQPTWQAAAIAAGLLVQQPDGSYAAPPGCSIVTIGSIILSPAGLDASGNVTTPAVVDSRYHVDFQFDPNVIPEAKWATICLEWMNSGTAGAHPNKNEKSLLLNGVELIDPSSIATRRHQWA